MKSSYRVHMSILLFALLIAACSATTPVGSSVSPLATGSASPLPTASAVPTETVIPSPTPTREPVQLVVLHTNDNWGETEPCG